MDNGSSWNPVNNGLTNLNIYSLAISGNNIFAGTLSGIFLSTNNGSSWNDIGLTGLLVYSLAISGCNIFAGTWGDGIFLSTDNGSSWNEVNNGLMNLIINSLAISGTNIFASTWGDGVFFSTDNGSSWNVISTGLTNLFVLPLAINEDYIFAGMWGGCIWRRPLNEFIPVELVSFVANVQPDCTIMLNWETATEINNKGFEIQRSNGGEFEPIAFVNGNGTITEVQAYSYLDRDVKGGTYSYRLKQVDFDGTFKYSKVVNVDVTTPAVYTLGQNYPNPFNSSTTIRYSIPNQSKVIIKVFDILGKEIGILVNEEKPAGNYEIDFNASELPSGVYFYQLKAGDFVETKKMIPLK
jgi:hypothetical protein